MSAILPAKNAEPRWVSPTTAAVSTRVPFTDGVWADDLNVAGHKRAWLWAGYLAPGYLTLLTAEWRSGKTTLLSILLARMKEGGALAERAVAPGKALVISEEPREDWDKRHQQLGLGHVVFFCRPFRNRPLLPDWVALLEHISELNRRHRFGLIVVDSLFKFLPGRSEASAAVVIDALQPLQHLAEQGVSVLVLHHTRKGAVVWGQAARGSGALPAFADISLEMYLCDAGNLKDRRRRLLGFSHHEETPRQLLLELNAAGSDYEVLADYQGDEFMEQWSALRLVLEDAGDKWTARRILEQWSDDYPRPSTTTLWRLLRRAVALRLLCQDGSGRKNDPHRYWVREQEARWQSDPVVSLRQQVSEEARDLEARYPGALANLAGSRFLEVPAAGAAPETPEVAPAAPAAEPAAAPASGRSLGGANADWLRPYLAPAKELPGSRGDNG